METRLHTEIVLKMSGLLKIKFNFSLKQKRKCIFKLKCLYTEEIARDCQIYSSFRDPVF